MKVRVEREDGSLEKIELSAGTYASCSMAISTPPPERG
jgi:hypothetical protein